MSAIHDSATISCVQCGAKCCRYLALEIDKPSDKQDYDHIRWYLLHEKVHVFMDHEGGWFLEFETPCTSLQGEDHLCHNYDNRPEICRNHGEEDDHSECEFHSDEEPHAYRFSSATEFEAYLEDKGIDWRIREKKNSRKR